ncbi:MAG: hypothetical protein DCF32_16805 [Leptolyngbya sp.]|nr:MAG: hypothetical protein DCF32_16805 [Leptolyngbya sp.]
MTESQMERARAKDFTQFIGRDSVDRPFRIPSYLLNQDEPEEYQTLVLGLGGVSPVTRFEAVTDDVTSLQLMQIENPVSDNLEAYLPPDKGLVAQHQMLQQSTNPNGSDQWSYPTPALMWQIVVIVLTVMLLF